MKTIKVLIFAVCLLSAAMVTKAITGHKNRPQEHTVNKGFAVVELFTSEGCSSCPPADELVGRIQKESSNDPVYILAFHVDYWNRLGWKDVFSNAEYSKRQRQYAGWLNLQSVYTPQIVVNGRKEFIGSEEGTLRNAIKSNLQKSAGTQLLLDDLKQTSNNITLQYHITTAPASTALLFALVEKAAQSKVKSGENGGRTLSHVQIVRQLQSISLNGKTNGKGNITIPQGLNNKELEVIAFLQNEVNGEIIAANKYTLSPDKMAMVP